MIAGSYLGSQILGVWLCNKNILPLDMFMNTGLQKIMKFLNTTASLGMEEGTKDLFEAKFFGYM